MELGAVRVFENRNVPEGTIYILGEFPKPPEWAVMTKWQQIEYAIVHGAQLIVWNRDHVFALLTAYGMLEDA